MLQLSEQGQTYLIYALRIVGFCVGGVTTALGVYVLASKRDTDVRDIVLDLYRIVFGTRAATHLAPSPRPRRTAHRAVRHPLTSAWRSCARLQVC